MEALNLDEETEDQLLRRLYNEVLQYLSVMRIPNADMEDILQETIVAAWENMSKLKDISKACAWVKSIARNKASKYFKSRSKYWEKHYFYGDYEWGLAGEAGDGSLGDMVLENMPLENMTLENMTLVEEELVYEKMECFRDTEIYDMIQDLGEPASIILALHYGYQETYEEIAKTLHMKPGTVRSIATRSREKLKVRIQKEGERHAYRGIQEAGR